MTDTHTKEPIDLMEECHEKSMTYMNRIHQLADKLGDIGISRDDNVLIGVAIQIHEVRLDILDNGILFLKYAVEAVGE